MTAEQNQQLDSLYQTYLASKNLYDIEAQQNSQGHAIQSNNGPWQYPWNGQSVTQAVFIDWLHSSDSSLIMKRNKMNGDLAAYNQYKNDILALTQQQILQTNPELGVQMAQVQAEAQVNATQAVQQEKADAAAATAKEKQSKNKTVIIVVSVIGGVIVIATVLYFVFRKKKGGNG